MANNEFLRRLVVERLQNVRTELIAFGGHFEGKFEIEAAVCLARLNYPPLVAGLSSLGLTGEAAQLEGCLNRIVEAFFVGQALIGAEQDPIRRQELESQKWPHLNDSAEERKHRLRVVLIEPFDAIQQIESLLQALVSEPILSSMEHDSGERNEIERSMESGVADAVIDPPLSGRAREFLEALLDLQAFDSDHKKSTAEVVLKAVGSNSDANSFKVVVTGLVKFGLVATREGRGGGCWLTEAGKTRAENCRKG